MLFSTLTKLCNTCPTRVSPSQLEAESVDMRLAPPFSYQEGSCGVHSHTSCCVFLWEHTKQKGLQYGSCECLTNGQPIFHRSSIFAHFYLWHIAARTYAQSHQHFSFSFCNNHYPSDCERICKCGFDLPVLMADDKTFAGAFWTFVGLLGKYFGSDGFSYIFK